MRRIAISDIHGCVNTFRVLLEEQIRLTRQDELYLLGDYVDRGPDSKGILDLILSMQHDGYQLHCLMGNHEAMMLNAWKDEEDVSIWMQNGGRTTLESFGVEDVEEIADKYFFLLRNFRYFIEVDNYILVHAGLNFKSFGVNDETNFLWKVTQPFKDFKSMMWIRDWYPDLDKEWLRDRVIIHGHTPMGEDQIWRMFYGLYEFPVIDIDNGCFVNFQDGMGQLCAFDMTNRRLYFQPNIEREYISTKKIYL